MNKMRGTMAILPTAGDDAHAQSPPPPPEPAAGGDLNNRALGLLIRALALAIMAYTFAFTAWRARREPRDLAFVSGAYALLAALLLCLRRAERLAPDSPAAERQRLHVAVWVLTTALSCAFACRVSLLMPASLVAVIWCMTSFVVLLGFHMLVL